MQLKAIDIFSGCGGLSLGFQNQGVKILSAFEVWQEAANIYEANFSHKVYKVDLSDTKVAVNLINKYNPDIIIGGPPCQDFSHAGKRNEGNQAQLTICYAKIIEEISPQWFVMENVDRIQNSNTYKKARTIFKKSGYGLTEVVLDAAKCGVPQKRKRFFCIGEKSGTDGFLDNIIQKKISLKPMTVREYMRNEIATEYYYRHPRNYNRRAVFSIDEPAPTIRGVNRPIPKGYHGHIGDPVPVSQVRPLSTMERARIQTFPADFKWFGSKTIVETMIGNAVPVNLASFISSAINEYLGKSS